MSKLEYLLDENVSMKTFRRLKLADFLVKSVRTENLLGIDNGTLIVLCKEKKWILITHDKEFLTPAIKDNHGIIIIDIHPATDQVSGESLLNFLKTTKESDIIKKITMLERNIWRYKK